MEIKLSNGDRLTVPHGCKATVNGNEIVIENEFKFKDGDVLVVVIDNVECPFIFYNTSAAFCSYYIMLRPNGEISRTWFFNISELVYTRQATDDEKQYLFDKMKERGLRWNAEQKRVEKIMWRAKKGDRYWKLSSDLHMLGMQEDNDAFDQDSWECGNYFKTQEQAERAVEAIKETLRKFHEEND